VYLFEDDAAQINGNQLQFEIPVLGLSATLAKFRIEVTVGTPHAGSNLTVRLLAFRI